MSLCLSINFILTLLTPMDRDPNSPLAPLDQEVMNIENTFMRNSTGIGSVGSLALTSQFPQRPGHGTQGKRIAVYANYFKLMVQSNVSMTRYNVEVNPLPPGRKLRRVLQLLFERPEFTGVATDFKTLIISPRPLDIPNPFQTTVIYRAEGDDEASPNAATFAVRVVSPSSIPLSELLKYLSATNPSPAFPGKEELLNALNALLAFYPVAHDDVSNVGPKHFAEVGDRPNSHNIRDIGGGIEALRGFFQSVRPATGGLLLNVNVTHGIFLQPEPVNKLFPLLGTGSKQTLQKKLRLVRVRVTHIAPKKSKKTGEEFPRIKTILALAQKEDGQKEPNPPQVSSFGAGPKNVKFWLGDDSSKDADDKSQGGKGKGKGKDKPKPSGPALPTNTYISVYDYFRMSKPGRLLSLKYEVDTSSRISEHSVERKQSGSQRRNRR
jgi:eukaryotic translation initiation factor 2C